VAKSKYSMGQIREWAERYKVLGSFSAVGREFGVGTNAINRNLKRCKDELGLVFAFEEYNDLMAKGLKRCKGRCGLVKGLDEFESHSDGGYRSECRKCRATSNKEFRIEHADEVKSYAKDYREENAAVISAMRKSTYPLHRDKQLAQQRKHYNDNKSTIRAHRRVIHADRMKNDPEYALRHNLRARFHALIRDGMLNDSPTGVDSMIELIGCSVIELRDHLEKQFYARKGTGEMMAWGNRGLHGWHIDHIKPLISFNLNDFEQLKAAWNYTNLRPLWSEENWSKGAKNRGAK
jgi:hypothetical protein